MLITVARRANRENAYKYRRRAIGRAAICASRSDKTH
jgi:hypothetical protein